MASQLTQLNILLQPSGVSAGVKSSLLSGGALASGSLPAAVSSEFSALLKEMGVGSGANGAAAGARAETGVEVKVESGPVLPVTQEGINLPLDGQELPYLAALPPSSPA
ncbi:hypothetical protein, partial [Neptunomonas sp.]